MLVCSSPRLQRLAKLCGVDPEPPIGGAVRSVLCDRGIEPDGPPRKYDLLRRAAEEVIPRPALGQEGEKRIGRADFDAAQNIGAAGETGVALHPDGLPDNGD